MNLKKLDEALIRWEMKNELGEDRSDEGGKRERTVCVWKLGDRRLESVEVVKYLGVMISGDGRMEERGQE